MAIFQSKGKVYNITEILKNLVRDYEITAGRGRHSIFRWLEILIGK